MLILPSFTHHDIQMQHWQLPQLT